MRVSLLCKLLRVIVNMENTKPQKMAVSLKTLAAMLDAHRTSVRRWLADAGIRPVSIGNGKNGAIRYRWDEVQQWLDGLDHVD